MRPTTGLITAALALSVTVGAETKRGLEFRGSMYADLGVYHYIVEDNKDTADFSGTALLSLKFRNANRKHGKVEGDIDLLLPYGAAAERYLQAFQTPAPTVADTSDTIAQRVATEVQETASRYFELFSMGKTPLLMDLRKLYLAFYLPFADIALGRQIINFGKGYVFSPIDVFSSVMITDINFKRSGSDVANVRVPIGDLAGIDLTVQAPFWDSDHSTAAKVFATLLDWDLSLVGIYRHKSEEVVTGLTFRGDAFVGLYGEVVEHFVDGADEQYLEFMLGTDYSLNNKWFFGLEYYYKDRPSSMLSLWGRNNLYGSVQFSPNELMRISGTLIHQFDDQRTIGMLMYYYSLLQNTDLSVYLRGYNNMESIGAPDLEYAARVEVKF